MPLDPASMARLLADFRATLGDDLVGVYLYGSAVTGGFDAEISDLDLVVVTAASADSIALEVLDGIHERFCADHPDWRERLDIAYVGRGTLASFRTGGPVASISHDEPLQLYEDADDWLQTWYLVRFADAALVGSPVAEVIPPISTDEFVMAVARDAARIVERISTDQRPGVVAYTLLTLCRVLRALEDGTIVSKQAAAEWLAARRPSLAPILNEAIVVRQSGGHRPFDAATSDRAVALIARIGEEIRERELERRSGG
jgi:hypothetical protein